MHQNKNSNASAFSALDKSYDKLGKVFNFRWCKIDMNRMYEKRNTIPNMFYPYLLHEDDKLHLTYEYSMNSLV